MGLIHTSEDLPSNNQYVLIHLTIDNWGDMDDPNGDRYWRVAKFKRGLSDEERSLLPDDDRRKITYRGEDQWANNLVPYCWDEFGPDSHFGQDVDLWHELPAL